MRIHARNHPGLQPITTKVNHRNPRAKETTMNQTANTTERTDNEKATMNAMRIVGEFYGMADRMDGYSDAVLVADVVGILHETTDLNDVTISETLASLRAKRLIDRGCEDKGPDLEYIHFTDHGRAAWDADAAAQDTPDSEEATAQVERKKPIMNDTELQRMLKTLLEEISYMETDDLDQFSLSRELADIERVTTFDEAGLMTRDAGLVITTNDGNEFQLSIRQSR